MRSGVRRGRWRTGPRCARGGGAGRNCCVAPFAVESEVCARCGGARRIMAFVTEPAAIRRMLTHLKRRGVEARAGPWAGATAG